MLLGRHALASHANACTGRVAQLVRALVSHTRGPGFESLRDHWPLRTRARRVSGGPPSGSAPSHYRMLRFSHLRTVVATAVICAVAQPIHAQQPTGQRPSAQQARDILQARPELVQQLRQRLVTSGMTREQIHARLRAEGYPEDILDPYLPG